MFKLSSKPTGGKWAGPGFITLNILRVINIIVLLTVAVASWIMLVMTVKTSNFYFFDGAAHFITSVISIFLLVSELSMFEKYFEKKWPLLSLQSGFVFLGMAMIVLGLNVMANLNKEATSVKNLGLPLWRVVIASGCLAAIIGFFNIIAGFVFGNAKAGITSRQVRKYGAVADQNIGKSSGSSLRSASSGSYIPEYVLPSYNDTNEKPQRKSKFGFKLPLKISRPIINDPEQFNDQFQHHQTQPQMQQPATPSVQPATPPMDSRRSPIMPELSRPPTAMHPAHSGAYTPSRYSTASYMSRF